MLLLLLLLRGGAYDSAKTPSFLRASPPVARAVLPSQLDFFLGVNLTANG